ncbi:MAG TPA: hypothetical protein VFL27_14960 [Candidatus Dormibacteraeota bacterium]|nr:hypothetical protein [Candidatus Dormibacteraeota bacterium]
MRKTLAGLFAVALLSGCGATGTGLRPSPSPSQAPSGSPSALPTPSSSSSPTVAPSPTPPAGFGLASITGGAVSDSTVTAVRVGQQSGYDRFVIEFGGGVPNFSVTPQDNTTFTRSPRGDQVTLEGTTGVLVIVHSVTNWTSYSGPTAFQPGYPYLRQALQVENFEGYQQWALGVKGTVYVRVMTLGSPNRLVVDVYGA